MSDVAMRIARWLLAVAAVGAMLLSADRRRTLWQLGIGLLVGGLALAVLLTVGREIATQMAPSGRGPAGHRNTWRTL